MANPADGSVTLPEKLQYWKPGVGGNMIAIVCRQIRLQFTDYVIDPNSAGAVTPNETEEIERLRAQIAELEE